MNRVHAAVLVLQSLLEGEDRLDVLRGDQLDRRHFVGGAETIEEMKEGDAAVDAVGETPKACRTRKGEKPRPNRELPERSATKDTQIRSRDQQTAPSRTARVWNTSP